MKSGKRRLKSVPVSPKRKRVRKPGDALPPPPKFCGDCGTQLPANGVCELCKALTCAECGNELNIDIGRCDYCDLAALSQFRKRMNGMFATPVNCALLVMLDRLIAELTAKTTDEDDDS